MVFNSLRRAFGVGGPTVDTALHMPDVRPGEFVNGEVRFAGGEHEVEIERIVVALVTRVETETSDGEYDATVEFAQRQLTGGFRLAPGMRHAVPFQLAVPWETPISHIYGQRLAGMAIGVRTELEVARAVDKSDLDPINVHPLPAQAAVLAGFVALGFQFKSADLERGFIYGVQQTLPFYQEIEFWAAPQFQGRITEVELTFVTAPQGLEIVIELDKRSGGRDAVSRFKVGHAQAAAMDWPREIDARMRQIGHF